MIPLVAGLMLAVAAPGGEAQPGFDYVERRETYTVRASSRSELVAALRHAQASEIDEGGGGGSVARTAQDLRMRYELEPVAGGCRFKGLEVSLAVTIHLPNWVPVGKPSKSLLQRWDRMRDALERHEHGHRDIALDSARFLHEGLLALGVQEDCQTLRREAQRVFFRAQLRHSVRDGAYEHRTRHGIAQGAVL